MASYQVPSSFNSPLTFSVQLEGQSYTLTVFYLFFGQRFYFTLTDLLGNIIVTKPLISSNGDINNLYGYFVTSTLYYSASDQLIVIA